MLIDWNHFTPWASLAGGILLGLASLGAGQPKAAAFVLAMLAGMLLFELGERRVQRLDALESC